VYLAEGDEYNEEEANKMTWKATYDVATDTMVGHMDGPRPGGWDLRDAEKQLNPSYFLSVFNHKYCAFPIGVNRYK
jgi:hypothetical protein